jgi:hypothetical protein
MGSLMACCEVNFVIQLYSMSSKEGWLCLGGHILEPGSNPKRHVSLCEGYNPT